MRILVTGSTGFIGVALVEKLLKEGCAVSCLLRESSQTHRLANLPVELAYGDFADPQTLAPLVCNKDLVIHLAGVTKAKRAQDYLEGNLVVTANLLQACELAGAPNLKFVYVSSQAAAGPSSNRAINEQDPARPVSVYGQAKFRAEQAVLSYGQKRPVTIVRPSSVYGPRDRDILVYFQNVQKGLLLLLGKGEQKISLIHVQDLVQGIWLASCNSASNGRIYFLSGDGEYDWKTIGNSIAAILHKKPLTLYIPVFLLHVVSLASRGAAFFSSAPALLNKDKVREMVQPNWLCSNERAKKELGFSPQYSLHDGLIQTAEWYMQQGWLEK